MVLLALIWMAFGVVGMVVGVDEGEPVPFWLGALAATIGLLLLLFGEAAGVVK